MLLSTCCSLRLFALPLASPSPLMRSITAITLLLFAGLAALLAVPLSAQAETKLVASDAAAADYFGVSVSDAAQRAPLAL